MSMYFSINLVSYVICPISFCEKKMIELENLKKQIQCKDKWKYFDSIPVLPLLRVNQRQPILHISKRSININITENCINLFVIGNMVNPKLNVNKDFREQVEIFLRITFHQHNMTGINTVLGNE